MEIIYELIRVLDILSTAPLMQLNSNPRWNVPSPGCVKLNTDGAIDMAGGDAGAGVVGRHSSRSSKQMVRTTSQIICINPWLGLSSTSISKVLKRSGS